MNLSGTPYCKTFLGRLLVVIAMLILQPEGQAQQATGRQLSKNQQTHELHKAVKLNDRSLQLQENGKFQEAIELMKQALVIRRQLHGDVHPEVAVALNNLGTAYKGQAKLREAEICLKQALETFEKSLGRRHTYTAMSINNLAELYVAQGEYDEAEPLYQRALKIQEKILGVKDTDTLITQNNLAELYRLQGKYMDAEQVILRVLEIRKEALGADHPHTLVSINNLASLYQSQSKFEEAEKLFQRALASRQSNLGADHADVAISLKNLASVLVEQAKYASASRIYARAQRIEEKLYGTEHPNVGLNLNNIGNLHGLQGDFVSAIGFHRRALVIFEKKLGPEHSLVAVCLQNLAEMHARIDQHDEAISLHERALQIREKAVGNDHPDTAMSLNHLASLYCTQKKHAAAEAMARRALHIREKRLGIGHPHTAASLNVLAQLAQSQGRHDEAELLVERAYEICRLSLGPSHPSTSIVLGNLALIYVAQKRESEAFSTIDKVRRGQRTYMSQLLPELSPTDQEHILRNNFQNFWHLALSLALRQAGSMETLESSATWLVNGKGSAHEALAQRNLLTRDIDHPTRGPAVTELLSIRTQMSRLAMTAAEVGKEKLRDQELATLANKERELVSQLGRDTVRPPAEWIELAQICAALPTDSVLIDIARFNVYRFTAQGDEPKWQPANYAAWITYPGSESDSVLVDLGDAATIDGLVEKVRQQIAADASQAGVITRSGEDKATEQLMNDLEALSRRIWEPLASHVGDANQLVLSPDGALWLAPWSALPITDSGDEYLLERYNLRMIVSGRDLLAKPRKRTTHPSVVLANPRFDQPRSQKLAAIKAVFQTVVEGEGVRTGGFSAQSKLPQAQPLPGTGLEAQAIKPHISAYTGEQAVLYQKQYALERVAKSLHGPQIAAFATHGFFFPDQRTKLENQSLLLADTGRSVVLDTTGTPTENPLLRCGLLLSGCNDPGGSVGDDDGILTGMEIVGIDFRGTELVVLSACETGVGDVKNGEGVAGLRQAFQLAGAEAVMATLWQIPDRESALLMSGFFKELAAGKSKTEALRIAQLDRIKSRRERFGAAHPFFWAAFTLTGM